MRGIAGETRVDRGNKEEEVGVSESVLEKQVKIWRNGSDTCTESKQMSFWKMARKDEDDLDCDGDCVN